MDPLPEPASRLDDPHDPIDRSRSIALPAAPAESRGSFRLFRVAGTDVFVHWSWFLAAYFLIQNRMFPYTSFVWDVAEYVGGFALVLLHEFGHVLACRQVGGTADRVVLWPLGGLAFVAPPPRPGANLWTTAAGPLVNVVLVPLLVALLVFTRPADGAPASDLGHLGMALAVFNVIMLVFNLLPIYPMDGGRILQALLWWPLGRAASLAVAAGIGAVVSGGLLLATLAASEWYLAFMAGFLLLGALGGIGQSRLLARMATAQRRTGIVCPGCGASPPVGAFWRCARCFALFDIFALAAPCPKGGDHVAAETCPECLRPY
jgi:Zn-dependent protease